MSDDALAVIKTPPVPTTGELPPPDPNGPYGVATDYVNVRSGPGMNYPVIGGCCAQPLAGEISGKSADSCLVASESQHRLFSGWFGLGKCRIYQCFNIGSVPVVEAPPVPTPSTNPNPPEGSYSCILVSQSRWTAPFWRQVQPLIWPGTVQNVGTRNPGPTADTVISKIGAEVDQPLSSIDTL